MTVLGKAGIDDNQRHDLVYVWTQGRTSSTKDLTEDEIRDIIWKFENQYSAPVAAQVSIDSEMRRKRSIVLKLATENGLKEVDGWDKFNAFMASRSIHRKSLNEYSVSELDELIKQFRGIAENNKRYPSKKTIRFLGGIILN